MQFSMILKQVLKNLAAVWLSLDDMVNFQITRSQRPRRKMHSNNFSEAWPELVCFFCGDLQAFVVYDITLPLNSRVGIFPENHRPDFSRARTWGESVGLNGAPITTWRWTLKGVGLFNLNNQYLLPLWVPFLPWSDTVFLEVALFHLHLKRTNSLMILQLLLDGSEPISQGMVLLCRWGLPCSAPSNSLGLTVSMSLFIHYLGLSHIENYLWI